MYLETTVYEQKVTLLVLYMGVVINSIIKCQ